jgi:hypothetical protein
MAATARRRILKGEFAVTLAEKIEANANLVLWCVHILGPDDVLAAPSHEAAAVHARELNKAVLSLRDTPIDVLCFAYAAPWPHSRADHAEAVKNWLKD